MEVLARGIEIVGGFIFFTGVAMLAFSILFGWLFHVRASFVGGGICFISGAVIAGIGALLCYLLGIPVQALDSSTGGTLITVSVVIGVIVGIILDVNHQAALHERILKL